MEFAEIFHWPVVFFDLFWRLPLKVMLGTKLFSLLTHLLGVDAVAFCFDVQLFVSAKTTYRRQSAKIYSVQEKRRQKGGVLLKIHV